MENTQELYNKEQEMFKKICETNPDSCKTIKRLSYKGALQHIGIFKDTTKLKDGYINLYQQDFLVEEILQDGSYVTLSVGDINIDTKDDQKKRTLYGTLTKANMSTFDAVSSLASSLQVPVKQISYAGIKDAMAITAQQIAFRDIDSSKIGEVSIPGVLLHSFHWGKGILEKGKQHGNHFTIIVRTAEPVSTNHIERIVSEAGDGFYNYYFFQRFGTPRLISHMLGKYLLRRNYKDAVKIFFCEKGASYQPVIADTRAEALACFGDWKKIQELFAPYPYTFRRENSMLEYLVEHSEDYLGCLKTQGEQPLFWIYAYASFLFNGYISSVRSKGEYIPPVVPLLLNPKYKDNQFYTAQLEKDAITKITDALRDLTGYAPMSEKNVCVAKIRAKNIETKVLTNALAFSFDLPVGAYATTFLSNFFNIIKGKPRPDWVTTERFDSKQELGKGSLSEVEKIFVEVLLKDDQV